MASATAGGSGLIVDVGGSGPAGRGFGVCLMLTLAMCRSPVLFRWLNDRNALDAGNLLRINDDLLFVAVVGVANHIQLFAHA